MPMPFSTRDMDNHAGSDDHFFFWCGYNTFTFRYIQDLLGGVSVKYIFRTGIKFYQTIFNFKGGYDSEQRKIGL